MVRLQLAPLPTESLGDRHPLIYRQHSLVRHHHLSPRRPHRILHVNIRRLHPEQPRSLPAPAQPLGGRLPGQLNPTVLLQFHLWPLVSHGYFGAGLGARIAVSCARRAAASGFPLCVWWRCWLFWLAPPSVAWGWRSSVIDGEEKTTL